MTDQFSYTQNQALGIHRQHGHLRLWRAPSGYLTLRTSDGHAIAELVGGYIALLTKKRARTRSMSMGLLSATLRAFRRQSDFRADAAQEAALMAGGAPARGTATSRRHRRRRCCCCDTRSNRDSCVQRLRGGDGAGGRGNCTRGGSSAAAVEDRVIQDLEEKLRQLQVAKAEAEARAAALSAASQAQAASKSKAAAAGPAAKQQSVVTYVLVLCCVLFVCVRLSDRLVCDCVVAE